ncbi:MAG: alpha/beta hydrolase [Candidatus Pseudobacter hemicellulosilyticus]|uniref:Alpha/beta hydrolase n=1 Tax=Candidatus Pseudobacter hemicellulosilyticus TaxID=3121375 RepID=A0AAJ5WTF0_9BACT|nr:MAG: alpha/beta hydrolase [Pseudobacter sp.]
MRKRKWLFIVPLVLLIVYLLGPKPAQPHYSTQMPAVPADPAQLQQYVTAHEAAHHLKPDNEARIVWANDSLRQPTEVAIVYLHGFSASQEEGDPVHKDIARRFGANLYLSRLSEHGLDTTDNMLHLTADSYWESAKEALAIGRQLGRKVILMGTSTGGTLALKLAADYPDVYALVLLSPNIAINDGNAWLLNNPWGLQIARLVKGSDYLHSTQDTRDVYKQYWTPRYRLEAAVSLQELLETAMTDATFAKVKQPTLTLYYFKDQVHQDSVVKVSAILDMVKALGSPASQNIAMAIPGAGNHVIGSWIKSHDIEGVEAAINGFMTETLGLSPQ